MTRRSLSRLTRDAEAPLLLESFFVAAVASFLGIRWFLALTGYPRIGSNGIHIAHMLWGGLLVPEVDGPKLIEILWNDALRTIEGPDSQGAPIDPAEVWTRLHETLATLGLELDLRASGASATPWPTHGDGIPVEEIIRLASRYPDES